MKSQKSWKSWVLVFAFLPFLPPPEATAQQPSKSQLEKAVRGLLKSWHHLDETWLVDASHIVLARYEEATYPCIISHDGTLDMINSQIFLVRRQLKGRMARDTFDVNLLGDPHAAFPDPMVEGRRYLIFLRPGSEARAMLRSDEKPFTMFTSLGRDEFLAVLDLDQRKKESRAAMTTLEQWQRREAFTFSSEAWDRLRVTRRVDAETLGALHHAIRRQELPRWKFWEDVRKTLGEPDEISITTDGDKLERYDLNPADRDRPAKGTLVGTVQLTYDSRLGLTRYSEAFEIFEGGSFRPVSYEERTTLSVDPTMITRMSYYERPKR